MSLEEIRNEIDAIDEELLSLFIRRMECSRRVAQYKYDNGLPIFNAQREEQILDKVESAAGDYGSSARQLYTSIIQLSRSLQHDMLGSGENLRQHILHAQKHIPYASDDQRVICFGVPGTYAHKACRSFFPKVTPVFRPTFHEVFTALENEEADFAVIPIENSSAGSVTDVYDLMLRYRFSIAAAISLPIDHCLAAKEGTTLQSIRQIYSHEQALYQCSDYLRSRALQKEVCHSTAAAAAMVSESDRHDIAVICSEEAAEKYGLTILLRGFQNNPHNTTRFLLITKNLYIEDSADKISLCFSLPHVTGSLYHILGRLAADGLNLTKIESRPKPNTDFEYLFYLDFTGTIKDPRTLALLCALSEEMTDFSFLGNYKSM